MYYCIDRSNPALGGERKGKVTRRFGTRARRKTLLEGQGDTSSLGASEANQDFIYTIIDYSLC